MSSPIPSTLRFSIVHAVASRDFTLLERPPFRFHAITLTRRCCRVGAVHSIKSRHPAFEIEVRFTPNSGHRAPLIRSPRQHAQLERIVLKLSEMMAEVHVQAAGRMSEPEPILERHRAKAGLGAQRK